MALELARLLVRQVVADERADQLARLARVHVHRPSRQLRSFVLFVNVRRVLVGNVRVSPGTGRRSGRRGRRRGGRDIARDELVETELVAVLLEPLLREAKLLVLNGASGGRRLGHRVSREAAECRARDAPGKAS